MRACVSPRCASSRATTSSMSCAQPSAVCPLTPEATSQFLVGDAVEQVGDHGVASGLPQIDEALVLEFMAEQAHTACRQVGTDDPSCDRTRG